MTAIPAGQDVTGTRQLEAWRERVMPPVEQLAGDLWSIPVPIPNNPLRYVSSYAFAAGAGLVLLDTGWDADASWQALLAAWPRSGRARRTCAACLSATCTSTTSASPGGCAPRPARGSRCTRPTARCSPARGCASPEEAVAQEAAFLRSSAPRRARRRRRWARRPGYAPFLRIAVPDRELCDGDLADVPGWRLRAVHTPGHTPGHLCFVDEVSRRLFSGDHILPRITPNISLMWGENPEALADYLASLAKVRELDVDEIMPAHEWRFRGLAERADGIAAHHERRLAELLAVIAAHPGETPWFLAGQLTWSRTWDQYSGRMRIIAVTETAAHVLELVGRGLVTSSGGDVPAYRVAGRPVG